MKVKCYLRELRGKTPIRDVAEAADVSRGTLSYIELGRLLPTDEQIPGMERAYGKPVHEWYPPQVLLAIEFDGRDGGR